MTLTHSVDITTEPGATGDVYYRSSTGLWLPIGGPRAAGNVITDQAGGVPLWATPAVATSAPAWATYDPDTPPTSPTTFGGTVYDLEFVRDASTGSGTDIGSPATAPSIVDRALRIVGGTSASADLKGREWVCPTTAFTMTAKLRRKILTTTFGAFGLGLRRNTSGAGNMLLSTAFTSTLYTASSIEIDKYTAVTTRSANVSALNFGSALFVPYYLRWVYDGTNVTHYLSLTGHADTFVLHFTETAATFLGGAPGRFLVAMDSFGTGAASGYCEWIRFT